MYDTQLPFAELHQTLLQYSGEHAFSHVLDRWLDDNVDQLDWIADFQCRTKSDWSVATSEDLAKLYAVFRVTSVLLLRFQARNERDGNGGPAISLEEFCRFHELLGFQICSDAEYQPFFHEILSVRSSSINDQPIQIDESIWPCLMLGDLMFCRSGCNVIAGSNHAQSSVVERSTLYWTYLRNDRLCNDLSHGWGHNSQWRTDHRRDYFAEGSFHYNVDGCISLNDPCADTDDLSIETCIELVRNRCLVTTSIDDTDLWPYDYTYSEKA